MKSHQLINQTSGNTEYYTPKFIIDAARTVMGTIDLDPASSLRANELIQATKIFTVQDDALKQPEWRGNVWMNHPFHQGERKCKKNCKKKGCPRRGYCIAEDIPSNADWINKLNNEYLHCRVPRALCITFASTSEAWFRPLHRYPQCYLTPRTNYSTPDGTGLIGVTKGSVVTFMPFMPTEIQTFCEVFSEFGAIKLPWKPE